MSDHNGSDGTNGDLKKRITIIFIVVVAGGGLGGTLTWYFTQNYEGCPPTSGNALAVYSLCEKCGNGCTSKFVCLAGFEYNKSLSHGSLPPTYLCMDNKWEDVPMNLCIQTETTTTDAGNNLNVTSEVCPTSVGYAFAKSNFCGDCGIGCISEFLCVNGSKYNKTLVNGTKPSYTCSRSAEKPEWDPPVPLDLCIPEITANTFYPNSGPAIAVTGGILVIFAIGLIVYISIKSGPNKITLYVGFGLCVSVWVIALGLCFGMPSNDSAVIAGIVLGSLALTGMVVTIGLLFSQIRVEITEKTEESVPMN